jgi:SSS family solute:Na+ symporter
VIVTIVVSLLTKPKEDKELEGLVYGLTQMPSSAHLPLYKRPMFWAAVVAGVFVVLQIIFW